MRSVFAVAALLLSSSSVAGASLPKCPTDAPFADAAACACPKGYGMVLSGNGGGQCSKLRCQTGAPLDPKRDCDCPDGYEKHKIAKGKLRCEAKKP